MLALPEQRVPIPRARLCRASCCKQAGRVACFASKSPAHVNSLCWHCLVVDTLLQSPPCVTSYLARGLTKEAFVEVPLCRPCWNMWFLTVGGTSAAHQRIGPPGPCLRYQRSGSLFHALDSAVRRVASRQHIEHLVLLPPTGRHATVAAVPCAPVRFAHVCAASSSQDSPGLGSEEQPPARCTLDPKTPRPQAFTRPRPLILLPEP